MAIFDVAEPYGQAAIVLAFFPMDHVFFRSDAFDHLLKWPRADPKDQERDQYHQKHFFHVMSPDDAYPRNSFASSPGFAALDFEDRGNRYLVLFSKVYARKGTGADLIGDLPGDPPHYPAGVCAVLDGVGSILGRRFPFDMLWVYAA